MTITTNYTDTLHRAVNDVDYHADVPFTTKPRIVSEIIRDGLELLISQDGREFIKSLFLKYWS